jgi:hypothetical protein
VNDGGFLKLKTGMFWIDTIPLPQSKVTTRAVAGETSAVMTARSRAIAGEISGQFAEQQPSNVRAGDGQCLFATAEISAQRPP